MPRVEELEQMEPEVEAEPQREPDESDPQYAEARAAIEERNRAQVDAELQQTHDADGLMDPNQDSAAETAEAAPAPAPDTTPVLVELAEALLRRFGDDSIDALAAQEEFIETATALQPASERERLSEGHRQIFRQYLEDARLVEIGGQRLARAYQEGTLSASEAQAEFLAWCEQQFVALDRDGENVKWGWVTYFARLSELSAEPAVAEPAAEESPPAT